MGQLEELQAKLDYLIALQKKQSEPLKQIYLFDWLDEYWRVYKQARVSSTRAYEIESVIRLHIKPNIENRLMIEYLPMDIEEAIFKVENGRTRETAYQIYNEAFRLARKNKFIVNNIMEDVHPVHHKRKNGRALTRKEQRKFLTIIKFNKFKDYFLFLLYSGARKSEALSVTWNDVDLQKRVIHIKGTKTATSDRYMPISTSLLHLLERLFLGRISNGRLFPFTPNQVAKAFQRLQCQYNLEFTLHSLRHTFATRCLESGVSIRVVQKWLGHSRLDTTAKTYVHILSSFEIAEAEKVKI